QLSLPYWQPERQLIDNQYRDIRMNKFSMNRKMFTLETEMDSAHLINYIRTWSVLPEMKYQVGENVLDPLKAQPYRKFTASFPVFLYFGKNL
ncbi:MAG: hypothetical protein P8X57_06620, partial [Cyclobacteriaceae bacterium]